MLLTKYHTFSQKNNILALDCSNINASFALKTKQGYTQLTNNNQTLKHSQVVLEKITILLEKNHLTLQKIDALCVGIGPGSFTGIRTALTVAKTLSLTHNIPLIGCCNLFTLAYANQTHNNEWTIAHFNSGTQNHYIAAYQNQIPFITPTLMHSEKVQDIHFENHQPWTIIGSDNASSQELFQNTNITYQIKKNPCVHLARFMIDQSIKQPQPLQNYSNIQPQYIQKQIATPSKK